MVLLSFALSLRKRLIISLCALIVQYHLITSLFAVTLRKGLLGKTYQSDNQLETWTRDLVVVGKVCSCTQFVQ